MKTINEIIEIGATFWGVTIDQLKSPRRTEELALARFSVMIACSHYGHTQVEIGKALNRDHAIVSYAARAANPDKFGRRWATHQRFVALFGIQDKTAEVKNFDALKAVLRSVLDQIDGVEKQIEVMIDTREKLLTLRNTIQNDIDNSGTPTLAGRPCALPNGKPASVSIVQGSGRVRGQELPVVSSEQALAMRGVRPDSRRA